MRATCRRSSQVPYKLCAPNPQPHSDRVASEMNVRAAHPAGRCVMQRWACVAQMCVSATTTWCGGGGNTVASSSGRDPPQHTHTHNNTPHAVLPEWVCVCNDTAPAQQSTPLPAPFSNASGAAVATCQSEWLIGHNQVHHTPTHKHTGSLRVLRNRIGSTAASRTVFHILGMLRGVVRACVTPGALS